MHDDTTARTQGKHQAQPGLTTHQLHQRAGRQTAARTLGVGRV